MLRLVSLFGLFALLGLCVALSRHRRAISWRLVVLGMLIQAGLGGIFLYWDTGNAWLRGFGQDVKRFLDRAQSGTEFVFGDLGRGSKPTDLYLYESADGAQFRPAGPFAFGARAASFAVDADGDLLAVFEWPADDLPAELRRLGLMRRGADGRWSRPRAVLLDGLPEALRAPFAPCLTALPDGRLRLYFSAHEAPQRAPAVWSAVSEDGARFAFEPGARLAVPDQALVDVAVARLGDTWHLYAPVRDGPPGRAHHATSADGRAFALGPEVSLGWGSPWRGSVVAAPSAAELRFYGSGFAARSTDGATWAPLAGFAVTDGTVVDPGAVLLDDGGSVTALLALPGRPGVGFVFATQVVPTLIFFSAFMGVLYHLGIMQTLVRAMAAVMARLLHTSGAESLSACGNIFVGQTEAPLMVRPFLDRMTMSELHAVMTGGFATIAGGVFALYVGFGIDPGHLMVASVMAAPAGLVCSKILWPETETSDTMGKVVRSEGSPSANVVEAAATGAVDGLKLALNVAAMLIAFLGLVAILDWGLGAIGELVGYGGLSVGRILGWLFSPIAAVMGVPRGEILLLGELLGTKIALTELVAYQQLGALKAAEAVSPRTLLIASFALCGFANLGSVAIQIGGLSAMAPGRRTDLSRLALRAMLAGAIATCITACMAGVMSDV
ncbi:MAG: nucleoside transporter C-terminal domain-containing protein [Planctomycetota bacterium]